MSSKFAYAPSTPLESEAEHAELSLNTAHALAARPVAEVARGQRGRSQNVTVHIQGHAPEGAARGAEAWIQVHLSAPSEPFEEEATRVFDRTLFDSARSAQDTVRCPIDKSLSASSILAARSSWLPWLQVAASFAACLFSLSLFLDFPAATSHRAQIRVHESAVGSARAREPELVVAQPIAATPPSAPEPIVLHARRSRPNRQARKERADSKAQAQATVVGTYLTVSSRPWMEVFIDGKRVGGTPLRRFNVGAGKHELKVRNRDYGLSARFVLQAAKDARESHELTFD